MCPMPENEDDFCAVWILTSLFLKNDNIWKLICQTWAKITVGERKRRTYLYTIIQLIHEKCLTKRNQIQYLGLFSGARAGCFYEFYECLFIRCQWTAITFIGMRKADIDELPPSHHQELSLWYRSAGSDRAKTKPRGKTDGRIAEALHNVEGMSIKTVDVWTGLRIIFGISIQHRVPQNSQGDLSELKRLSRADVPYWLLRQTV